MIRAPGNGLGTGSGPLCLSLRGFKVRCDVNQAGIQGWIGRIGKHIDGFDLFSFFCLYFRQWLGHSPSRGGVTLPIFRAGSCVQVRDIQFPHHFHGEAHLLSFSVIRPGRRVTQHALSAIIEF